MDERMVIMIKKEELFLNEFENAAIVAADSLNHEWNPNFYADDSYRSNLKYFFSQGEIKDLTFDSASVYYMGNRFSSLQINLKSSHRLVTVKVKMVNEKLIAEKLVDKSLE